MKPISERAIEAVLSRLRMINTADDYATNAGTNVHRSRRSFAPEELPAISVFEAAEEPANKKASDAKPSMSIGLRLSIFLHAKCDLEDTGELLGLMRADFKRAVLGWAAESPDGRGVRDADGQIGALTYNGAVALPREEGSVSESVECSIVIDYLEGFGDPYVVI